MEIKSIDDWMFSETSIIKFNFSPPLKIPEFEYIINKDEKYFLIQTAREISLTNGYNISNNDILIEISKQWGAEIKDNFDKINDIDFRAIFRYKMYQKYNKSEIT